MESNTQNLFNIKNSSTNLSTIVYENAVILYNQVKEKIIKGLNLGYKDYSFYINKISLYNYNYKRQFKINYTLNKKELSIEIIDNSITIDINIDRNITDSNFKNLFIQKAVSLFYTSEYDNWEIPTPSKIIEIFGDTIEYKDNDIQVLNEIIGFIHSWNSINFTLVQDEIYHFMVNHIKENLDRHDISLKKYMHGLIVNNFNLNFKIKKYILDNKETILPYIWYFLIDSNLLEKYQYWYPKNIFAKIYREHNILQLNDYIKETIVDVKKNGVNTDIFKNNYIKFINDKKYDINLVYVLMYRLENMAKSFKNIINYLMYIAIKDTRNNTHLYNELSVYEYGFIVDIACINNEREYTFQIEGHDLIEILNKKLILDYYSTHILQLDYGIPEVTNTINREYGNLNIQFTSKIIQEEYDNYEKPLLEFNIEDVIHTRYYILDISEIIKDININYSTIIQKIKKI